MGDVFTSVWGQVFGMVFFAPACFTINLPNAISVRLVVPKAATVTFEQCD